MVLYLPALSRQLQKRKHSCVPLVASAPRLPHFVLHAFFENIPHEEVFRVCRIF